MKKRISLLILTALCGVLTACGVKGPLYFPAPEQQQDQQAQPVLKNQSEPTQSQQ